MPTRLQDKMKLKKKDGISPTKKTALLKKKKGPDPIKRRMREVEGARKMFSPFGPFPKEESRGRGGGRTFVRNKQTFPNQDKSASPRPKIKHEQTLFRKVYDRGDLPIKLEKVSKVGWRSDPKSLDFHHYLPIFFHGLRESEEPYRSLARLGVKTLIRVGGPEGRVLPCIPSIIIPLKKALDTREKAIICRALDVLQCLVEDGGDMIGEALVPYYRQLLPIMNIFINHHKNLGDAIDYGQSKGDDIGDLIQQTLMCLETHGGEDAFINIKYMIPTYESCVL